MADGNGESSPGQHLNPVMMSSLLPPPKALDTTAADTWQEWKKWIMEFDLFAMATHLAQQTDNVQAATFLICIGEEGRRIYNTFAFDCEDDKKKLKVLKEKFQSYLKPAENLTYHEYVFGKRDQKPNERFDDWLTDLKAMIRNCEYGDLENRMLKSRIVLGTNDKQLQQKLITENPTYEKVLERCRIKERSQEQFKEISSDERKSEACAAVNLLQRKTPHCPRCGYLEHRTNYCPAAGKICSKCGTLNHFAKVCRNPPEEHRTKHIMRGHTRKPAATRKTHERERVRQLQSSPHTEDDSDEDYFLNHLSIGGVRKHDRWSIRLRIEQDDVHCKLDTGANCSVIPSRLVKLLTPKKVKNCSTTLSTFFGHRKKAVGKVALQVQNAGRCITEDFYVVQEDVPTTLSGSLCERLGLLKRIETISETDTNPQVQYPVAKPYDDIFHGLGKVKDVVYSMKLKPGVQGVVRPARKVPVAMRQKVYEELKKMEQDGVISKVEGPTEWSSYMVVVVKPNKVRICIDPVDLNKALLREHYPMMTLEDVVEKVGHPKWFSTLDAASG
ncbi:uncharacterized protein LOC135398631 [Ornithodoros turicata]|uniref:uncharacterized protein LOC135398631 n=1 Tax=Ornithodoros turicata TaxID=34597 RepID=UPI0031388876